MSLTTASPVEFLAPSFDGLFPLPLTPMEAFMVVDAGEDYSMMCDTELQFQGCVDRDAFDVALAVALDRNPLLGCLVGRDPAGTWVWTPTDRLPPVDWAPLGTPIAADYGHSIDLGARSDCGSGSARDRSSQTCCSSSITLAPMEWGFWVSAKT